MKWGLQSSVPMATNISKSHQIPSFSLFLTRQLTHTRTQTHNQTHSGPLHLPRDRTRGLGKRWPAFGSPPRPLHPARGCDGRKLVLPPGTPTLLPWRASQSARINHSRGRGEATVEHMQTHWKECSSLK